METSEPRSSPRPCSSASIAVRRFGSMGKPSLDATAGVTSSASTRHARPSTPRDALPPRYVRLRRGPPTTTTRPRRAGVMSLTATAGRDSPPRLQRDEQIDEAVRPGIGLDLGIDTECGEALRVRGLLAIEHAQHHAAAGLHVREERMRERGPSVARDQHVVRFLERDAGFDDDLTDARTAVAVRWRWSSSTHCSGVKTSATSGSATARLRRTTRRRLSIGASGR